MRIVEPSFEYINKPDYQDMLYVTETAIRNCYQSEPKGDPSSIIRKILDKKHESTLEHVSITIKAIIDRGVSHEWVRHRVGVGYSQSSTRYCNYSKNKFGNEIKVIPPRRFMYKPVLYERWEDNCRECEHEYMWFLSEGAKPEDARSVLPHSLATELVCTMNIRAWRHFFKLRCSKKAHPDMRYIACMIRDDFIKNYPIFFSDLIEKEE